MAWLRVQLTEEQQRIVNEERTSHPNPRIREKMLVLLLLHNGVTRRRRPRSSELVEPPCSDTWRRFVRGAWMVCGSGTPIARSAKWPPTAS